MLDGKGMENAFRYVLHHKGIKPEDVGVEVPEPYIRPVEVLTPARLKNMKERFPEKTIISDMPTLRS